MTKKDRAEALEEMRKYFEREDPAQVAFIEAAGNMRKRPRIPS